jgi:hypothetical protein
MFPGIEQKRRRDFRQVVIRAGFDGITGNSGSPESEFAF